MTILINNKNLEGQELAALLDKELTGKKIKSITSHQIVLENGIKIDIEEHEGCGGCSNGWSAMELVGEYDDLDAAVMNVKYQDASTLCGDEFKMFIYLADDRIITFNGDDGYGNGYYGGGFWVTVTKCMFINK